MSSAQSTRPRSSRSNGSPTFHPWEATICNHYRNDPEKIPTWAEYAGYTLPEGGEWSETKIDIYPGGKGLVVRSDGAARVIEPMTWGFPTRRPRKRAPKEGQNPWVNEFWTNARNLGGGMWKPWLSKAEHHCLIPFNTFAEPIKGRGREEWWFTVNDAEVSCFAGVWKPDREFGKVYAFLTCEPNALVQPMHEKAMPVILQPEDYETWLTSDYAGACALQQPFPSQLMRLA